VPDQEPTPALRGAVLGLGMIGRHHARLLQASPRVAFAGAVDPALIEQWAQSAGQAVAERTEDVLREAGVSYTFRQEIGHPADRIVRVAEHEKCDLIVIGSRGLSGVKEFLLGSVSSRVSHHAPCAVLIVH